MLPKNLRLAASETRELKKHGKRASKNNIELMVFSKNTEKNFRWFINVPKKAISKAHDRSRAKRLIAHSLVKLNPLLVDKGIGVVKVRRALVYQRQSQVQNTLYQLLARLKLIKMKAGVV